MKKAFHIIKEVISWLLLAALLLIFAFTVYSNITNENKGEGTFVFGYRPVLVLTGSMEPYMMTNGIALTKEVSDIDELSVGDVVTYHVEDEEGELLRITHRIVTIEGDLIYTKGDNNQVEDGFPLTIENIEAKVVVVANFTAWIAAKWQGSIAGKVMLISFAFGAILLYVLVKMVVRDLMEKRKQRREAADEPNEALEYDGTEESIPAPLDETEAGLAEPVMEELNSKATIEE